MHFRGFAAGVAAAVLSLLLGCETAAPACSPETCPGCCDIASGRCFAGTVPEQCGSRGLICQVCLPTQTCATGVCQQGIEPDAGRLPAADAGTPPDAGAGAGGCAGTLIACGTACIDAQADFANCGRCGLVCGAGQVCNRGRCEALPDDCAAKGGCAPGYFCEPASKKCLPGCRLPSDCPSGATCERGRCACPLNQHACGQRCVSDQSASSCGDSCQACPTEANGAAVCARGQCTVTCSSGFLRCGSTCRPCTTPPNAVPLCNGNSCDFRCLGGYHRCGDQCLADMSTASCGQSCAPCRSDAHGQATCDGTQCGIRCNPDALLCSGACAPCATPPHADPICSGAVCVYKCQVGYHACGSQCLSNSSTASCGAACTACPSVAHGVPSCSFGSCGVTCDVGYELAGGQCLLQSSWTRMNPASTPLARQGIALAYDVQAARTVLFGGSDIINGNESFLAETWEWNGTNWTRRTTTTFPPARSGHAMAYDEARRRMVLFGGFGSTSAGFTFFADTWEWDGVTWTQRTPATSPPGRRKHALAYDAQRARVVLYGGESSLIGDRLSDTWEWDGSNWVQFTGVQAPTARSESTLAFDRVRGRTVLFGGRSFGAGGEFEDTWEWDGSRWYSFSPATSPFARGGHAAAFFGSRGRTVIFGGRYTRPFYESSFSDTWEWDGGSWVKRAPSGGSPTAGLPGAMAYDSARQRGVLFAHGETWELTVP